MNNREIISEAIRKGLRKKAITQQELASKLGLTKGAISSWCTGYAMPPSDTLLKIAAILDIIEDLFPGYVRAKDPPKPPSEIEKLWEAIEELRQQRGTPAVVQTQNGTVNHAVAVGKIKNGKE